MITKLILCICILLIIVCLILAYFLDSIAKFFCTILFAVCIFVFAINYGTTSIEFNCKINHISYDFVKTVSEWTEEPMADVYAVCKYAPQNGWEPYDVIKIIEPDMMDDEIMMLVQLSDKRQEGK